MFQFTPYALLPLAGTLVSLWLAVAIWSRRPAPGIKPYVVMSIGLLIWTSSAAARLFVTPLSVKLLISQITYIGITIVPAAWLIFVLEYTGNQKWVTRRNLLLLTIEPIFVQLAILTNPTTNAFWINPTVNQVSGVVVLETTSGGLFWVHAIYSYVLLLISCVVLFHTLIRSPHLYRGQVIYLLIAVFAPWIANIVFLAGLSPLPSFVDLTPLSFVITVMAMALSMYRFRLLDLVPIARDVIVENMEDAIIVLDMSNRVLDVNTAAAHLINQPTKDIVGKPIIDILPQRADLIRSFADVENTETELEIQIGETTRFFNIRISSIYNRQQVATGRIATLHDITVLKESNLALQRANQQAQEMTRLKSQFLATMSHELRTPLNAIIGYTELQLAGIVGELNEKQHQYQDRVLSNAQHLLDLINDVLDLSKIEAGRMELIQEPFNVRDWVDDLVKQNTILADEKGLEFVADIDAKLPDILIGDSGRLKQVVINLLSNAIKFTHKGQVKLSIQLRGTDKWIICVDDTGIGIPPHKQETIFDEFRQVDNSSTRQYSGTGLGLAIVRKLVYSMGGIVRVQSTVDEGSQFTVILPLINHNPQIDIVA